MSDDRNVWGYRFYQYHGKGDFCRGLWQKAVRKGEKNLFFINMYKWSFPGQIRDAWSCEVRMYTQTKSFDLNLMVDGEPNPEDIEKFYSDAYDSLGCVPDRHNNSEG